MRSAALLVLALAATGCLGDVDPQWQLDHERIVAVRSTPVGVGSGERAELDALLAYVGEGTVEEVPELAGVVAPMSLADALARDGDAWVVTGPDADRLAAARAELDLPADAPVPLQVGVSFPSGLAGLKVVWLGIAADNPVLGEVTVDGAPPAAEIVIGRDVDVPLAIDAGETDEVNWLTSVGNMHDFDLPEAYLRVEPDNPTEGELAVVLRDERGGVTWQVWPIRAE